MLAPKFTIRQLLIGMIGLAVVSAILGWAARGNIVAYGLSLSIVGLFIPFLTYAAIYLITKPIFGRDRVK